jgi:hypothetical protein
MFNIITYYSYVNSHYTHNAWQDSVTYTICIKLGVFIYFMFSVI